MRRLLIAGSIAVLCAGSAAAQDPYPVSVGAGGGVFSTWNEYHALVTVALKPARSPVALRLDGVLRPRTTRYVGDALSAVSASAVVTLRPWRISPYLVVGATRTSEYVANSVLSNLHFTRPATTQLTGGLGLEARLGRGTMFFEMRQLRDSGIPLSLGFSF